MTQIHKRMRLSPKQAAACCKPIDGLLDPTLFKGLSDPTRLQLLGCLAKCGRPCSVSELAECCLVDFSVVSRHLALLERSGIVSAAKDGRTVFYSVRYEDLSGKLRALADAIESCCPDCACKSEKKSKSKKHACCDKGFLETHTRSINRAKHDIRGAT